MGKIPARGFITKLYSATAPTVSKYGKKYLNRAKLTAQCVYTFYESFYSLTEYEYEFFSEHFIHNNARGIHYYS